MRFSLKNVVPWGRSFDEYAAMFALSEEDLGKRILGCADGPAGFNATLTRRGGRVVSVDPIYRFSVEEIRSRIAETYGEVMAQTRENAHAFVWRHIHSPEALGLARMSAMEAFLSDYRTGRNENRYVAGSLPDLPFKDQSHDLVLCSHILFLYSEHFSLDFHVRSIREFCRVAKEARIFPLLELNAEKSRHLEAVKAQLREGGFSMSVDATPYEFQRGGNQMLRIQKPKS